MNLFFYIRFTVYLVLQFSLYNRWEGWGPSCTLTWIVSLKGRQLVERGTGGVHA